jgi:UDP-N-acetylmuramoyl-tripeptide--D-alanyl-D-alanine ligase
MQQKILQLILKYLAKLVINKYRPVVIGITGSIGKTSAKDAIYFVLSKKFNVRRNIKNYNNEIGVPLTILGLESPGKSIIKWFILKIIFLKLILFKDKNYPKILILEMGVDRPGDMEYLMDMVKCNIGIITTIEPVHLEYFGTINKIQNEKGLLIKNLKDNGWAIFNYDNEKSRELIEQSRSKVMTYGFDEKADVQARELFFSFHGKAGENDNLENLAGVSFKLGYKGSFVPVMLPSVIGKAAVYSALAGAAVGLAYGLNLIEISESLKSYQPPKGRMNIIKGINNSMIIDDTYNSSPTAAITALEVIKEIPIAKIYSKIAVLGDMLELGSFSEEGHKEVGRSMYKSGISKLITVGVRSSDIAKGAQELGMSTENITCFSDSEQAGRFVKTIIKNGDLIFVKGSQGMRMEKVVKEIMAEPERAGELLVRQDGGWIRN